jgi:DNA-binding PadR family transcriptional regulator
MTYRRPGTLLPFELAILLTLARLEDSGITAVHGSALAHQLPGERDPARLLRSGWIYRCLAQLVERGLVAVSVSTANPSTRLQPRRYYRLTADGRAALMDVARQRSRRRW